MREMTKAFLPSDEELLNDLMDCIGKGEIGKAMRVRDRILQRMPDRQVAKAPEQQDMPVIGGWIKHTPGDPCPVSLDTEVVVRFSNKETAEQPGPARFWYWGKGIAPGSEIIAYKVVA